MDNEKTKSKQDLFKRTIFDKEKDNVAHGNSAFHAKFFKP